MFHYFYQKEFDVILLQETHFTKQKIKLYKTQWGGAEYFIHLENLTLEECPF